MRRFSKKIALVIAIIWESSYSNTVFFDSDINFGWRLNMYYNSKHFGMCFVQMISVKNSTVVAARSFASLEVFGGTFRSWLWNRQWSGAAYLLHLWYKIQEQRLFSYFQYVLSKWGISYHAISNSKQFFLSYFIR